MANEELIIDSFAGGGGASLGIQWALGRGPDVAINHEPKAIAMHAANHPHTRHLTEDVFRTDPRAVTGGKRVGLLWASPDCFPEGTLVLTKTEGLKPIEQVQVGELVLTHKNRWRRVTNRSSKSAETVTVKGHGHYGLVTTPNHPFYSKRITKRYPGAGPDGKRPGEVRTLVENPYWPKAEEMADKLWATPAHVPPSVMPLCEGIEFGSDFFYFLGRWVGDGSLNKGDAEICCGNDEVAILCDWFTAHPLKNAAGEVVPFRVVDHGSSKLLVWGNARLAEWLRAHCGDSSESKHVPAWLLGAQACWRRAFMDGYCEADGCLVEGVMMTSTVSRALAIGVRLLATSLGKSPTMHFYVGRTGEIEGRKFAGRDGYSVRWRLVNLAERCFRDSLHHFSPVREVLPTGRTEQVYCLEVDEDESYTADGIVVHNCTHHSRAKGGTPVRKDIRGLAWVVIKWAGTVCPRVIVLENVSEFEQWGPVCPLWRCGECDWKGTSGQAKLARRRKARCPECDSATAAPTADMVPNPDKKGITFRQFVGRLKGLGYRVEWKTLNAADYGAPTHRRRLFLIARNDGRPIVWPEETHGDPKTIGTDLFSGDLKPWRTAAECIDWAPPCPSIFMTKAEAKRWAKEHGCASPQRPLKPNTLKRIAAGIKRYVLDNPRPFVVVNTTGNPPTGADEPLKTATTGNHHYLVTPTVLKFRGDATSGKSVADPLPTVTAGTGKRPAGAGHALGVCSPLLVPVTHAGERRANAPDEPVPTVTGANRGELSLITPVLAHLAHGDGTDGRGRGDRTSSVEAPTNTVHAGGNNFAVVAPVIARIGQTGGNGSYANGPDQPVTTITSKAEHLVVAPVLVQTGYGERTGQAPRALDIEAPLGTVVAGGAKHAVVSAFLAKHFWGVVGHAPERPLGTVTAVDHHSVVAANLVHLNHGEKTCSAADEPARTVVANGNHAALVYSFMTKYHGNGGQWAAVDEPAPTADTKDRFGLVTVTIDGQEYAIVDIGMRMLTPRELARAQGFPDDYVLCPADLERVRRDGNFVTVPTLTVKWGSKSDQVERIGNSVSPYPACAIVRANCADMARKAVAA